MTPARPLRILHLIGAAEDNGGVLSVVRNLAALGPAHGLEHVALVNRAFQQMRRPALELLRSEHLLMEHPRSLELLRRGYATARELRGLPGRFDLLHAHSRGPLMAALFACLRSGGRGIFTNHAYANGRAVYHVAARWPRLWTTLLTPNMARHYGLPVRPPRVSVLSECAADDFFSAPLAGRRGSGAAGPVRFVGVGNLVRWKNWHLVIAALARLPAELRARGRFDLWGPVAGEPDAQRYAGELRAAVAAAGLGTCVTQAGPTHDVQGVVAAADCFVLPSTNEPCSVALIEALALGVPALVSASGGNVDIVRDRETGRLFQPESVEDLADCLADVISGRWASAPPERVRESVRSRSATVVAEEFARLYRAAAMRG